MILPRTAPTGWSNAPYGGASPGCFWGDKWGDNGDGTLYACDGIADELMGRRARGGGQVDEVDTVGSVENLL